MSAPTGSGSQPSAIDELLACCVVDASAQREFASIAGLASYICGTHAAVVRVADGAIWRVKASIGLPGERDIRSAAALCAHAMHDLGCGEVRDTLLDPRLRELDLVRRDPRIRFYCGVPLLAHGQTLGVLSVFDHAPNELAIEQHWALRQLAELAATLVRSLSTPTG